MNDPLYFFYIRCKSTSLLLSQLSFDITPYNGGHIYYTYIIHILKYCTFSDQMNNICVKQTTICLYDKAYYNTAISYNTYTMIFHLIFSTIQIYSFHSFKHNTTFTYYIHTTLRLRQSAISNLCIFLPKSSSGWYQRRIQTFFKKQIGFQNNLL